MVLYHTRSFRFLFFYDYIMASSSIFAGDYEIPKLPKSKVLYIDKATVLYGASNTGKGILINEILKITVDDIPLIFVFQPTAGAENTLNGIVPDMVVYKTVNLKDIVNIYNRQDAATKIFDAANRLDVLKKLFDKCRTSEYTEIEEFICTGADKTLRIIENDSAYNDVRKAKSSKKVIDDKNDMLRKVYKKAIKSYKHKLLAHNLTKYELYAINYIDFNPRCMVIFDDCAADLAHWEIVILLKKCFSKRDGNICQVYGRFKMIKSLTHR